MAAQSKANLMRKLRTERADLRVQLIEAGFDLDDAGCPVPKDVERRERLSHDFITALTWYFPETFIKEHTDGQKGDIRLIQDAMYNGGQFAFAAPRGDGKSSRAECCAILALLYGLHPFLLYIGAEQGLADDAMEAIKLELRTNDRLLDDFPEVCVAVRAIDDKAQRARAMNYDGNDLHFRWNKELIALPCVPGSASAGAVLVPRGITGRIRGMKRKLPNGKNARPSLMIIDDFQTDESAHSPSQCRTREKLITNAILGAAGHSIKCTALAAITCIDPMDAATAILNRDKHPEWRGRTRAMVKEWPEAQDTLWDEYREIRRNCFKNDEPLQYATDFYAKNREAMDAGAVLDWVLDEGRPELSALQYAEDLLMDRGKESFFSEYQNDPFAEQAMAGKLDPEYIKNHTNGLRALEIPQDCKWVLVGADINKVGIHWAIVGESETSAAYVSHYGKSPRRDNLWDDDSDKENKQAKIYEGIFEFCRELQTYKLTGGRTQIDAVLIDCNHETHTVLLACAAADRVFPFKVVASRGYGDTKYTQRGAIGTPMDACHWAEFASLKGSRVVVYSSGVWHKRAFDAWRLEGGAPASLTLYDPPEGTTHQYIADHIANDVLVDVLTGSKGEVYLFDSGNKPNDLNDSVTQAIVGGAMFGANPAADIMRRELKSTQLAKHQRFKENYQL